MYLVEPSCSPRVDIVTKMLIKTNANEKIPYSVCVVYLTIMTLLTKPKSMPIIVPIKTNLSLKKKALPKKLLFFLLTQTFS